MNTKHKIIATILTILTLSLFYWLVLRKRKGQKVNTKLSNAKKINFNIKKLVEIIGKDNISSVENTHTKVKIFINNHKEINFDDIKNINGISGLINTTKHLTIVTGNNANLIAQELLKFIS